MWQFGLALSALCIGAALLRDRCIFGAAATLLVNWVVNTLMVQHVTSVPSWGIFITTDYLSGVFLLVGLGLVCHRFTIGAVVLALSYGFECVIHAAYGLSEQGAWADYRYWWSLFFVAVGQMLFVIAWGLYELARGYLRDRGGVASSPFSSAHHSSPPSGSEQ